MTRIGSTPYPRDSVSLSHQQIKEAPVVQPPVERYPPAGPEGAESALSLRCFLQKGNRGCAYDSGFVGVKRQKHNYSLHCLD